MSRETAGTLEFAPLLAGSSANVFKMVELGKAEAGATLDSDYAGLPAAEAGRFRIVMTTPAIASHPVSAHPRVPPAAREAVARAFLALGEDPRLAEALARVRLARPTRADYARDYRPLEDVTRGGPGDGR